MARRLLSASWGVYALMWALTFGATWTYAKISEQAEAPRVPEPPATISVSRRVASGAVERR
jgi:hypothetical protein